MTHKPTTSFCPWQTTSSSPIYNIRLAASQDTRELHLCLQCPFSWIKWEESCFFLSCSQCILLLLHLKGVNLCIVFLRSPLTEVISMFCSSHWKCFTWYPRVLFCFACVFFFSFTTNPHLSPASLDVSVKQMTAFFRCSRRSYREKMNSEHQKFLFVEVINIVKIFQEKQNENCLRCFRYHLSYTKNV